MENINDITSKIIACSMKVHNIIGSGFQEIIYQRALAIEMRIQGLSFEVEKEMTRHFPYRFEYFFVLNAFFP